MNGEEKITLFYLKLCVRKFIKYIYNINVIDEKVRYITEMKTQKI